MRANVAQHLAIVCQEVVGMKEERDEVGGECLRGECRNELFHSGTYQHTCMHKYVHEISMYIVVNLRCMIARS